MGEQPYRQSERLPTRRRVEAEETIAACEAKMTPLLLAYLPARLRERIEQLRAAAEGATDDARLELAESLEEALAIAKEREDELRALPDDPPSAPQLDDPWGPVGTDSAAAPVVDRVQACAREIDARAEVTSIGPRITARFRTRITARSTKQAAPILWSIHLGTQVASPSGGEALAFASSAHWMGIRVPEGHPKLFLRREGVVDTVLKAIKVRKEVEIDDTLFDAAFFVEGEPAFVRALLTPELRDAFVRRADFGDFTFLLRGSAASLAWEGGPVAGLATEAAVVPSVGVLVALRSALGGLELARRA